MPNILSTIMQFAKMLIQKCMKIQTTYINNKIKNDNVNSWSIAVNKNILYV